MTGLLAEGQQSAKRVKMSGKERLVRTPFSQVSEDFTLVIVSWALEASGFGEARIYESHKVVVMSTDEGHKEFITKLLLSLRSFWLGNH